MGPLELELMRQEEAAARQQAQQNTELQQINPTIVEQNIPNNLKPSAKAKLGKRILDLGKIALKIIIPKIISLVKEYSLEQFNQAKAQATTPEQIAALKAQFCPTPERLQQLITTRNNIVGRLNNLGTKFNTISISVTGLQDANDILKNTLDTINNAKAAISIAAGAALIAPVLAPLTVILNNLETIDDKVGPLLDNSSINLSSAFIPAAAFNSVISKIVNALNQLDALINLCAKDALGEEANLDTISNDIQSIINSQNQGDANDGTYKGFVLQIEEVPFSNTVTRRRAVALNKFGIQVLQTELSFTTNPTTLINELKFTIDRDNLKAF